MTSWANFTYASGAFMLIMLCVWCMAWYRNKQHGVLIDNMEKNLFISFRNITPDDKFADFSFEDACYTQEKYQPLIVNCLAPGLSKGYDMFYCESDKANITEVPYHKHHRSNELFYICKGKLTILKDDDKEVVVAEDNEWIYIKKGEKHRLVIDPDTKFLTIVKPPLFTRIGKLWKTLLKR